MKKILILLALITMTQVCKIQAQSENQKIDNAITIAKPSNEIWNKLVKYCVDNNITIKCIDKNTGLINFDFMPNSDSIEDYVDVVQSKINDKDIVSCSGNVYIIAATDNNQNLVKIISQFQVKKSKTKSIGKSTSSINETVKCQSTGKLEKAIFAYIEK